MTTLTSTSSAAEPLHARSGTSTMARSKNALRRVVAVLLLLAVATGGWVTLSSLRAGPEGDVSMFTVGPRRFSVMLKEKGELKAAISTDVMCEVEGRSTIISLVEEGTPVKKGDLLVELASDQIEDRIQQEELKAANAVAAFEAATTELEIRRDRNKSDIRQAELRIELTKLELEKYEKGDWTQRLKDAEIAIKEALITRDRRIEDYEAAIELRKRNFITKTEFEEAKFASEKAVWDLEKAQHARRVLEQYTHVSDRRLRESDVEEAIQEAGRVAKNADAEEAKQIATVEGKRKELELIQDQLTKLRRQNEQCRIYAPTQGFVVYFSGGGRHFSSSESQIREGASVHERQVILSLPDTSEMLVVVRIHESKTSKLSMGQKVRVTVEGLPGQQFDGTVTKIAALADTQNRWLNPDLKEYETEITMAPTDAVLKPGVTAFVEILVDEVEARAAVPVQAIYTKGSQRFVFHQSGGEASYSPVELGAIGMEWAEITSGVNSGDQVLLAFDDNYKRLVPEVERTRPSGYGDHRGPMPDGDMKPPSHGGASHGQPGDSRSGT